LPPPEHFNAAQHLLACNAQRPAKTAYIDDTQSLTFGALDERVRRFAAGLLGLGVHPEERVLMLLHDSVDFPVAFLGALYAGIVPVPVNTLLTVADYVYMLQHSHARVLLVSLPLLGTALDAHERSGVAAQVVVSGGAPAPAGTRSFASLLVAAPLEPPADTLADDFAFWLYSSGSTAAKGTVAHHANLYWTADCTARRCWACARTTGVFRPPSCVFAYGLATR